MTRRRLWWWLAAVIFAVVAFAVLMGWALYTEGQEKLFDLLKEGAPLAVGVGAALLANAFQKRSSFVGFLRDEWYNIVETKTALIVFCRRPDKSAETAHEAWARLSVAIDRMRILYRNVGETDRLIGKYPYEPLHRMRRAFEGAMVRNGWLAAAEDRDATVDWPEVEAIVVQGFQALREVFLEELDLTAPERPLLDGAAQRRKQDGAAWRAVK